MHKFSERTLFAIKLAKEAGQEIKRLLHNEDIQTKGKRLNDVVTVADTAMINKYKYLT